MNNIFRKIWNKMVRIVRWSWPVILHLFRILIILLFALDQLFQKIVRTLYRKVAAVSLRMLRSLKSWYWGLERKRRHWVGWIALLLLLCLGALGIWSVGKGVYSAGVWVKQLFIGQLKPDMPELPADELAIINLDAYSGNNRHRVFACGELNPKRRVVLYKDFKDLNDVQLVAARRLGIAPITSRDDLDKRLKKLVKLKNTRYYKLDPMHHSIPYLVPDAADFLTALGERWCAYHGTNSRFIVTSCLRTDKDIKKLRRGNVNATKDSCHRYGTTIDITYARFDRHGRVRDGKLKEDLARALMDMKEAGYCYVKYEYKQSCFHITVKPR